MKIHMLLYISLLICGCRQSNTKNSDLNKKKYSNLNNIQIDTNNYNKKYFSNYNYYKLAKMSNLSILMLNIKNDSVVEIVSDDDRMINPIAINRSILGNLNIVKDSIFYENSKINFNNISGTSKHQWIDSLKVNSAIVVDNNINVFKNLHIGISKEKFINEIFNVKKNSSLMKYNFFDIYYVIDDDHPKVLFAFENDSLKKILVGNVFY